MGSSNSHQLTCLLEGEVHGNRIRCIDLAKNVFAVHGGDRGSGLESCYPCGFEVSRRGHSFIDVDSIDLNHYYFHSCLRPLYKGQSLIFH